MLPTLTAVSATYTEVIVVMCMILIKAQLQYLVYNTTDNFNYRLFDLYQVGDYLLVKSVKREFEVR